MRTKRTIMLLVLALVLVFAAAPSFAESFPAEQKDWRVTFDGKAITGNYKATEVNAALKGMQPGDDAAISFTLTNKSGKDVDWWMENEVIKSLEDQSGTASGGAYTYTLTYTPKGGARQVLYTNDAVGGEQKVRPGLHEATDALKDYIWLGTMANGEEGTLTLAFAIDGETQRNGYQDTLGRIKVNFAAETPSEDVIKIPPGPDTGDRANLVLYGIVTAAALIALILLIVRRRKERDEE